MLKNCSFSVYSYKVYGCIGVDGEKYLGVAYSLSDVLEMCRSHVSEYDNFSIYANLTDVFSSVVCLDVLSSYDLNI